ncbi:MAG: hypothetical protein ACE363_05360 [Alphaproteobacteria bacterium]
MPGIYRRPAAFFAALIGIGAVMSMSGAQADTSYQVKNCTQWDVNVRVGLTEFDYANQQSLPVEGAATFPCAERQCVVVYGKADSQCSWSAMEGPASYVLRHVHSRMAEQCSYATETLGGDGSQFYYLRLEQGATC